MTMIEKVARAIAIEQAATDWHQCLTAARAAVEALRTPSVEMLSSALPQCPDWGYLPEDWSAMIEYVVREEIGVRV